MVRSGQPANRCFGGSQLFNRDILLRKYCTILAEQLGPNRGVPGHFGRFGATNSVNDLEIGHVRDPVTGRTGSRKVYSVLLKAATRLFPGSRASG